MSNVSEMIAVVTILGTVIGSIICGISAMIYGTYWVLRPLDSRAGERPLEQFRFRLIDGICLTAQWQVLLGCAAVMNQQAPSHLRGMPFIPGLVLCGIVLAIWAGSISRLNQARIQSSVRRSAFILFQPITLLAAVTLPIVMVNLAAAGLHLCFEPHSSKLGAAITGGILVITLSLLIASRLVSQWIAAEGRHASVDQGKAEDV